jgi:RNA polymerase sigma-70 factor (ECF subfamily)
LSVDVGQLGKARSDNELAFAAQQGDRAALEELLRRNFERIFVICRRITCHAEDAKDATQEALIAVHRHIGSFDGRASFSTWLFRVATNAALGEVRRRARRPQLSFDARMGSSGVSNRILVEQLVSERADIDTALGRLAPEFRAVVVLRDLYDLDYSTIGEVLDLPEGTVRSRLHRGRLALRAMLSDRAG